MTGIHPPELIPKTILRHWIENDDYLHAYSLLENWTPFEAACLINNYEPGAISGGIVRIGQEPDPANGEDYNQEPQEQFDQEYLITLTKIILRNNNNQAQIPAAEIVQWAVTKGLLRSSSYLARRLALLSEASHESSVNPTDASETKLEALTAELERVHKNTGKHHADKREKILGAALAEITLNRNLNKFFKKNGTLNASALAKHIDEFRRHIYDSFDGHGFSIDNIRDAILDALKSATKK